MEEELERVLPFCLILSTDGRPPKQTRIRRSSQKMKIEIRIAEKEEGRLVVAEDARRVLMRWEE